MPSLPDSENLTEQRQRRVTYWKLDGYDDVQIITSDMVTNACFLNQVIALIQVLI